MINGISRSQFQFVSTNRSKHYQKLAQIVNSPYRWYSSLDKNIIDVVNNRKYNHANWVQYQRYKTQQSKANQNIIIYNKISKISMNTSQYSQYNLQKNDSKGKLLHHYSFYNAKKKSRCIAIQNPEATLRIKNQKPFISNKQCIKDYIRTRQIVSRMEKFHTYRKMIFNKNDHQKLNKSHENIQTPKKLINFRIKTQNPSIHSQSKYSRLKDTRFKF